MGSDSANSSRPIVVKITSPDEANAAFDGIAYDKVCFQYKNVFLSTLI